MGRTDRQTDIPKVAGWRARIGTRESHNCCSHRTWDLHPPPAAVRPPLHLSHHHSAKTQQLLWSHLHCERTSWSSPKMGLRGCCTAELAIGRSSAIAAAAARELAWHKDEGTNAQVPALRKTQLAKRTMKKKMNKEGLTYGHLPWYPYCHGRNYSNSNSKWKLPLQVKPHASLWLCMYSSRKSEAIPSITIHRGKCYCNLTAVDPYLRKQNSRATILLNLLSWKPPNPSHIREWESGLREDDFGEVFGSG